jgi:hypothetical protein
VGDGAGRLPAIRISISIYFFQIFALRAKIWKK